MSNFPFMLGMSSVSKLCTRVLTLQAFHSAENNRCARERAFFDESTRVMSFTEKASHKAAEAGAGLSQYPKCEEVHFLQTVSKHLLLKKSAYRKLASNIKDKLPNS